MHIDNRIAQVKKWEEAIFADELALKNAEQQAYYKNRWFTPESQNQALRAIKSTMLASDKLKAWVDNYNPELLNNSNTKNIALILAGNIPLVGFHDFLSVLISGHHAQIKLSSKDSVLWHYLLEKLKEAAPALHKKVSLSERLRNFDAVIATGSNNSARYFDYYFGKYPNIIRKNRSSIAILDGSESDEDLLSLGEDIFQYYGFGCRNVSQLFVPENYDFKRLLDLYEQFKWVLDSDKYQNNFDYQLSIMLLNSEKFLQGTAILLKESPAISSPIATLHYQFYKDIKSARKFVEVNSDSIQCTLGKGYLDFGSSQTPSLTDYADNIDTMEFLLSLK